ncbi:MAG: T9SS type A sorting domain-containing protein [Bacteroidetes bacterium]|nr:T9SS type A sorting domain-containing protein [Bacteroidota bacterium]
MKIRNTELKINSISIFNLLGEEIFVQKVENANPTSEIEINVSSFTNGIYFIQLQGTNNSYARKFIKQ